MEKLFVIHYFPIERYPPVLNFLKLASRKSDLKVYTVSTKQKSSEYLHEENVTYFRIGLPFQETRIPVVSYLIHTIFCFIKLLLKRPSRILYYETVSSLAALLYIKFINSSCELYIHFHEYTSTKEYLGQNAFWKWVYRMEISTYKKVKSLSHTNEKRMELFLEDNQLKKAEVNSNIFPNYPSKEWCSGSKYIQERLVPIKLVYVGYAVDKESTYIVNLIDWLSKQELKSELDIYCFQKESFPAALEKEYENLQVNLCDSLSYFELPKVLVKYDIGLILYKGLSKNYTHNAPNKLFEYLACGLDVWFPSVMKEPKKYMSNQTPKVLEIDFEAMDNYKLASLIKQNDQKREISYYAEKVYEPLLKQIMK